MIIVLLGALSIVTSPRISDEWIDNMTTEITQLLKEPDDGRLYDRTEEYIYYIDNMNLTESEKIDLMNRVCESMKSKNTDDRWGE